MTTKRRRRDEAAVAPDVDREELARRFRLVARAKTEWEAAADAVADLVFLTDPQGRVLRCNAAARETLDRPFDRILGRDLTELVQRTLGIEALHLTDLRGRIRTSPTGPIYEYARFPASLDGAELGWVLVFRDVTELHRLHSVAGRIDMMNNLGQVLASVRHEIGNPTNAMKTALTVMAESVGEFSTEKMSSYIERCLSDVQRIQVLLERLRTFNLFEISVEESVDLGALLEDDLPAIREFLDDRGIVLTCSLPPDGHPIEARCDPRAVYQILLGLVANSSDAIAEIDHPGAIRLDLIATDESVTLSVSDNGPGIPPQLLDKVVLPLFTTKPRGTGLGLAIAHEMLTRMGGTLEIGNCPILGGARVAVGLPRSPGGTRSE